MRTHFRMLIAGLILSVLAGCQPGAARQYLVVDFEPGTDLKYRFISERQTSLTISQAKTATKKSKSKPLKMTEKMELVIAYKATAADEYGRTTVVGTCQSAKVTRRGTLVKNPARDAVEGLAGKTFSFTVLANGQIEDQSGLDKVVKEIGQKAFGAQRDGKNVKNLDMISDFIAMQWYLWDSVGMIRNPHKGVKLGQTWTAKQMIPMPIPRPTAKDTTYTLTETKDSDSGSVAVIDSTFQRSDEPVKNLPDPYDGQTYMLKEIFVFLRGYRLTSFTGSGRQIFNIDRGVIENDTQQHTMDFDVSFLLPLGDSVPKLKIDQKMKIELLE